MQPSKGWSDHGVYDESISAKKMPKLGLKIYCPGSNNRPNLKRVPSVSVNGLMVESSVLLTLESNEFG